MVDGNRLRMDVLEFVLPVFPATFLALLIWFKEDREFRRVRDIYGTTWAEWESARNASEKD